MTRHILLAVAVSAAAAGGARAQATEAPLAPAPRDTIAEDPGTITPGGAFLRSVILPGWGQSHFEAYTRGGVYFSGWVGNSFMNFKNQVKLQEARNRLDLRTGQIRRTLIAAAPNPDSMRAVLDTTNVLEQAVQGDDLGGHLRDLVRSREQQREDWIAWSLFWLLASGIDAFVTAHLADFPATIEMEPRAAGGLSVSLHVPWPRRSP
jgi:hypothetical protein